VTYETNDNDGSFRQHTVPLTVGLDFDIHRCARSKCLAEKLKQLHLAILHGKFMKTETSMFRLHACRRLSVKEVALNQ